MNKRNSLSSLRLRDVFFLHALHPVEIWIDQTLHELIRQTIIEIWSFFGVVSTILYGVVDMMFFSFNSILLPLYCVTIIEYIHNVT